MRLPSPLALLLLLAACLSVQAQDPDQPEAAPAPLLESVGKLGEADRNVASTRFIRQARKAIREQRFAEIEAAAAALRTPPMPTFADGPLGLKCLYDGLVPEKADLLAAEAWTEWQGHYAAWAAEVPDSPTRPIAQAEALVERAWALRGAGYADTVTESGWQGFASGLAAARAMLEAAPELCPQRRFTLLTVALGEGWERRDYDALFEAAVTAHPDYLPYYERKSIYLLPRWHGRVGELAEWAETEAARNRSRLAPTLYARAVLFAVGYTRDFEGLLRDEGFRWPRLKESLRALVAATPASTFNTLQAAKFAWQANDVEALREFFMPVHGRRPVLPFTDAEYAQVETLLGLVDAPADLVPARPHAIYLHQAPASTKVLGMVLSATGDAVIAGRMDGKVVRLALPGLELLAQTDEGGADSLALSPDGTRLAVVDYRKDASTLVELSSSTLRRLAPPRIVGASMNDLVYLDGTTLLATHAGSKLQPSLGLVPKDGPPRTLDWPRPSPGHFSKLSLSPDRGLVVFTERNSLAIHRLADDAFVARLPVPDKREPVQVAFSPDGRRIATVAVRSGRPGALLVWAGPDWAAGRIVARAEGPAGFMSCLAWSPDGRWIASGGDTGSVTLWSVESGVTRRFGTDMRWVRRILFSPDGRWLITASDDQSIRSWDWTTLSAEAQGRANP